MTQSKLIELCDEFIERGNKFVGDVTFKDLYFFKEAAVLAKATKITYEALKDITCSGDIYEDNTGKLINNVLSYAEEALAEVDKMMERKE